MSAMLRVTFYSYKGGVGRTLALLNVAAVLAAAGRKVVVVDLDLEAPGLGLSAATRKKHGHDALGVSDFIFERRSAVNVKVKPVQEYLYPVTEAACNNRLLLMPAGSRSTELAGRISDFYRDPAGDSAKLFQLLVAEIAHDISPDYLFFDSRTGLADIAGVCTVELPQLLVAVCGLSDQNVAGLKDVLDKLAEHPARVAGIPTMVVLSPLPRSLDLDPRDPEKVLEDAMVSRHAYEEIIRGHPLLGRIQGIQIVFDAMLRRGLAGSRREFPRLGVRDLWHGLDYDPWVPLADEIWISKSCRLVDQYRHLARSISLANEDDPGLEIEQGRPFWRLIRDDG